MRSVPQMTDGEGCLLGFVSRATLPPMSELLTALDAFLQEHPALRRAGRWSGRRYHLASLLVGRAECPLASAPVILKEEP